MIKPFPKEKILPVEQDVDIILDNYWSSFSSLFPNVIKQEFIRYIEEDDQLGAEETHQNALGRREGKILYSLIRILKPKNILEIGTYDGISTNHILKAASNNKKFDNIEATVTTLDINNYTHNSSFIDYPFIHLLESSFHHLNHTNHYDFIFQDGDHSKEGVSKEIKLFSTMKNLKCVMTHDYHLPNRGVQSAYTQYPDRVFHSQQDFKENLYNSGFLISLK